MTVEEEGAAKEKFLNKEMMIKEHSEVNSKQQNDMRSKMEAMQKRICELKEKVKNEGELLHNEIGGDINSITNSKDSLNFKGIDLENIDGNFKINLPDQNSEKSLYFSASSFSLCTASSSSSLDSTYNNFTKFVNNFVKNQSQKERLSLLQLHSNKQISHKMMKHSLTELDARCSEEMELVERSLERLNKLAEEFHVNTFEAEEYKPKALEFYSKGDTENWKCSTKTSSTFIWPPLNSKDPSKVPLDWTKNPAFEKKEEQEDICT